MEDLNVQVPYGFRIKPKRIVKEKSYYICSTDKGYRVIRKSLDTKSHIQFQHEIKEQLLARGLSSTDRYYTSLQEKPYFEYEDNVYVCTDLFDYRESNFSDNTEFCKIVAAVAKFHRLARDFKFSQGLYGSFYGNESILESFTKQCAEMDAIKKTIGQKSRLSDFDVLFLKNYAGYSKQIQDSIALLHKTKLHTKKQSAREHNTVCHNLLKEEHVLLGANGSYLIGFSQAAVDYQIFDLCSILQRYAKNLPDTPLGIYDILELYDKHMPLTKEDVEILYPLMKYPGKFIKICRQYYSKKRSWTPSAIINRMDGIISNKKSYDSFVESLIKD